MKYKLLLSFLAINVLTPIFALPGSPCNGTIINPCVVQDTKEDKPDDYIKHWRDAKILADAYSGDASGLKQLWLSGSAQPSAINFKIIAKKINAATDGKVKKIIDLDLRQEDHGYLNGQAITLAERHDWINFGKTTEQAISAENNWLRYLAILPAVFNVLSADQFKSGEYHAGKTVRVETINSEKSIAEKADFEYVRLTITDHMAPTDEDVDQFLEIVNNMSKQTWLAIHCRGGDGRTTTFMTMYDILKNADKVAFEEILRRQAAADPFYDLANIKDKDPILTPYYKARLAFLRSFYQYANDVLRGNKSTWSDWKRDQSNVIFLADNAQ